MFLSVFEQRAIVSGLVDEIGSVDCNQTAEQFYLQPVLGWLIKRRYKLLFFARAEIFILALWFICLFVCLLVFIDLILRVDSREPA